MELSVNLDYFAKGFQPLSETPTEDAYRLLHSVGYRVLDVSPGGYRDGTWQEKTRRHIALAEKYGFEIRQTHAPMNRYVQHPTEDFRKEMDRCLESARQMGVRHIVVHGENYNFAELGDFDREKARQYNYELHAPFVEKAATYGMETCFETVFEDGCFAEHGTPNRFTAALEELSGLVQSFHNPYAKYCWDFGHSHLSFEDEKAAMEQLGSGITSTHTHDNYYGKDLHLMPFEGNIDWKTMMATLKKTGYTGDLTFEFVYGTFPTVKLLERFAEESVLIGNELLKLF